MLLSRMTSRHYMIYHSYVDKVFYMKSLRVVYEVTQGWIWSHSGLYMKSLTVVYEVTHGYNEVTHGWISWNFNPA